MIMLSATIVLVWYDQGKESFISNWGLRKEKIMGIIYIKLRLEKDKNEG